MTVDTRLVAGTASANGTNMTVDTRPGAGTVMHFRVPMSRYASQAHEFLYDDYRVRSFGLGS